MHEAANTCLVAENGLSVEEMKARRYAKVAVRNAGTPGDVANAAVYLAGLNSAYVTGINCLSAAARRLEFKGMPKNINSAAACLTKNSSNKTLLS